MNLTQLRQLERAFTAMKPLADNIFARVGRQDRIAGTESDTTVHLTSLNDAAAGLHHAVVENLTKVDAAIRKEAVKGIPQAFLDKKLIPVLEAMRDRATDKIKKANLTRLINGLLDKQKANAQNKPWKFPVSHTRRISIENLTVGEFLEGLHYAQQQSRFLVRDVSSRRLEALRAEIRKFAKTQS